MGPCSAATIILNALDGYSYEVEPGAFISQPGIGGQPSPDIGTPGGGPILGVGLLFAIGTPETADLLDTSNILGFVRLDDPLTSFYFGGKASDIIGLDIQVTAIVAATGNLYHIDFLSWHRDIKPCLDNDGVSCSAAAGATSFNIELSPVPLPAALPLFASGLGLIGWFRRKKRNLADVREPCRRARGQGAHRRRGAGAVKLDR
jgi:hypothetical protein